VFADASDEFYGGTITQIEKADLELSVDHQRHEPLAFCSGAFKGAQQRWGTPEKEGFALIQVVVTFDYLLLRADQFHLFTGHRNLVYIFNPLSIDQSLARHTVAKLHRWALKLSVFKYIVEHISGELNLCADIFSR
jgi:RNase H-like domain found in reverse transcriptase